MPAAELCAKRCTEALTEDLQCSRQGGYTVLAFKELNPSRQDTYWMEIPIQCERLGQREAEKGIKENQARGESGWQVSFSRWGYPSLIPKNLNELINKHIGGEKAFLLKNKTQHTNGLQKSIWFSRIRQEIQCANYLRTQ